MTRKLRIVFLLPGAGTLPVGGFKVVYEYANRLSRRGHLVTVVHTALCHKHESWTGAGVGLARYVFKRTLGNFTPKQWFQIDPAVQMLWVPDLSPRYIPDADFVVATAWQTAEWAGGYPASKGGKMYLIQQLETWHGMDERALATWGLPFQKLVISQWLMQAAINMHSSAILQPNGIDFEHFYLAQPPSGRDPFTVMMLYHTGYNKGSDDGIRALSLVRQQFPNLKATLFGTPKRPADLPEWISYYRCPEQNLLRDLYNEHAVFVSPSWTEGWALPPAEAMMCGASVVATDIGGHRDYAIHEKTALLSPARDPEQLARNVVRVMSDDGLRLRLARAGNEFIQQFTWDRSVRQFEKILLEKKGHRATDDIDSNRDDSPSNSTILTTR